MSSLCAAAIEEGASTHSSHAHTHTHTHTHFVAKAVEEDITG